MGKNYSKEYIRGRINTWVRQGTKTKLIIENLSYEFGIKKHLLNSNMNPNELTNITSENQSHPSTLEKELANQTHYLENLRAA